RHLSRGGLSNAWRFDSATTARHIFFKALTKRGFLPVSRSIRSSEASWRKCHKTAKNVRAGLDSNLPSRRNAYKQISELSSGGFLSNHRRGFAERCREANSKREFGLGNLSGKVEMDMFGGLTKTSSRIAIASALGMTLGGFLMSSHPAKAADLGGDCCADLEERVAE